MSQKAEVPKTMAEGANDKLSIKNILFTKSIPSYAPNVPTSDYKLYVCIDCGDKYLFQSSYEYHINRKSLKITYMCRICHMVLYFYNRCRLLYHIRSHAFKSHTINVSDLKIEPLPLSECNIPALREPPPAITSNAADTPPTPKPVVKDKPNCALAPKRNIVVCWECKEDLTNSTILDHYRKGTGEMFSCVVCKYELPTNCALKAHLRLHIKEPPYICPECAKPVKSVTYPFLHQCKGFIKMREAARIECPTKKCGIYRTTEIMKHLYTHVKKAYKCTKCTIACFSRDSIQKHVKKHDGETKLSTFHVFYQCELCPGRLVLFTHLNSHLNSHTHDLVYPCLSCGVNFQQPLKLIVHANKCTVNKQVCANNAQSNSIQPTTTVDKEHLTSYRVVKKCEKCERSFTYKCKYAEIDNLPIECPYGCSPNTNAFITCGLCNHKIVNSWDVIKLHLTKRHSQHKPLDLKVVLKKIDISIWTKNDQTQGRITKKTKRATKVKKPQADNNHIVVVDSNVIKCKKCNASFDEKAMFTNHLLQHRDPCTAYQCLECGECYVVKPSFATHLLLEHDIGDVDEYVLKNKYCYNQEAMSCWLDNKSASNEPLKENQCSICREQFTNHDDLEKHFRQHGMAFLLRKSRKRNGP